MEFETWLFLGNIFLLCYSLYLTIDVVKLRNDIDLVERTICAIYEYTSVGKELTEAYKRGEL